MIEFGHLDYSRGEATDFFFSILRSMVNKMIIITMIKYNRWRRAATTTTTGSFQQTPLQGWSMCYTSKRLLWHLLRCVLMEPSLLGERLMRVVTAVQSKISFMMCCLDNPTRANWKKGPRITIGLVAMLFFFLVCVEIISIKYINNKKYVCVCVTLVCLNEVGCNTILTGYTQPEVAIVQGGEHSKT